MTEADQLKNLRVLILDNDAIRAEEFSEALRLRGAHASAASVDPLALGKARHLDPQVIVCDAQTSNSPGAKALKNDPQIRWAEFAVVDWDALWPSTADQPDIDSVANQLLPLCDADGRLRQLAKENAVCNVRFEELGPSRLLRGLGKVLGTRHVSIAGAAHAIDIDLADGLVVGAYASAANGPAEPVQGPQAILQLWDVESGEVEIRKQELPSIANIMSPIDETLGTAVRKLAVSEGWQVRGIKLASTAPPPNNPMPSYRVRLDAARKRQATQLGMPAVPVPEAIAQAKAFEDAATEKINIADLMEVSDANPPSVPPVARWRSTSPPPIVGQDDPVDDQFEAATPTSRYVATAVETKKSRGVAGIIAAAVLLGMTTLGYIWWKKNAPPEAPAPIVVIPSTIEPRQTDEVVAVLEEVARVEPDASNDEVVAMLEPQEPSEPAAEEAEIAPVVEEKVVEKTELSDAKPSSTDAAEHMKALPRDRAKASDVLVLRALRLLRGGEIGVAEELLSKATDLDRKNPRAMVATAELYLAQDKAAEALPLAKKAVSMRSRRSQYHVILGDALAGTGDSEGAKAAWQMALRKDRRNKDARARLQTLTQ